MTGTARVVDSRRFSTKAVLRALRSRLPLCNLPVEARLCERCTMLSAPICEGVERGRGIVWLHPDVVAEVTYSELMQGRLRDPVLRQVQSAAWRATRRRA